MAYQYLQLDKKIDDIDAIVQHPNLAEEFGDDDLKKIGMYCKETYDNDKLARENWENKMIPLLKSAMQIYEDKTHPWLGASNVRLPLITIAGFQFHTRAYSLLVPGQDVVRISYYGDDPDGLKSDASNRIAEHMNYQILEQDKEWERNMDLTLLVQASMGCAFKKVMFSPEDGYSVSRYISPWDLIVPYYTQSISSAVRISHRLCFTRNDCYEREVRGVFLPIEGDPNRYNAEADKLDEIKKGTYGEYGGTDYEAPYDVIEQHRYLDLDVDGYSEPYVVTFVQSTGQVLRIAARFFEEDVQYRSGLSKKSKKRIYKISPHEQFVKYPFIPSLDGCFYDTGFGSILGGLSNSIDSLFNQLIDAGTLSNLGGGFISRGLVIRSGNYRFKPGEYKIVDATGASLQEGIRDLPVREPSQVLLDLVRVMLDYADRVAGSTGTQQGENPGQNTPTDNYAGMLEEGGKIFRGLFKRTHRAFKEEMGLLFKLNSLYLSDHPTYFNSFSNSLSMPISRHDYLNNEYTVVPSADPEIGSDSMKFYMAKALSDLSDNAEGFDQYQVKLRILKAMRISNIDEVYPPPESKPPEEPPEDPKVTVAGIKAEVDTLKSQLEAKIEIIKTLTQKEIAVVRAAAAEAKGAAALSKAEGSGSDGVEKHLRSMQALEQEERQEGTPIEGKVAQADQSIAELTGQPAQDASIPQQQLGPGGGGAGAGATPVPAEGGPASGSQ